jgi:glycosyltransferase involved in cell wall biosynthesis
MRTLIIHTESEYLGGAEKMLGYYASEMLRQNRDIAITTTPGSRLGEVLPPEIRRIQIPGKQRFSPLHLWLQARAILNAQSDFPFDLVHAWIARSWELAALVGWLSRRPAVGSLHDHPQAQFISPPRRRLMLWAARLGLARVVCVSHAVRDACKTAGYPARKLSVVHNGLPAYEQPGQRSVNPVFQLGFLGVYSQRKGIDDLFIVLDRFAKITNRPWILKMAGGAQNVCAQALVDRLKQKYASRLWWPQVQWTGWCSNPIDFLHSLDLLIVPSSDFDPFPTVLLEAGLAGAPVLATRVGGVPEIVEHERTGWLFPAGNTTAATELLVELVAHPDRCRRAGACAASHIGQEFTVHRMVSKFAQLYASLHTHS